MNLSLKPLLLLRVDGIPLLALVADAQLFVDSMLGFGFIQLALDITIAEPGQGLVLDHAVPVLDVELLEDTVPLEDIARSGGLRLDLDQASLPGPADREGHQEE